MNAEAVRWLEFARGDLRMAELALADGLWGQACFHAQQSAEKALKGLLVRKGAIPPRTHKLADLLHLLGGDNFPELSDDIRALDRFCLPTRYPDTLPDSALPGEAEAREALAAASAALDAVLPDRFGR